MTTSGDRRRTPGAARRQAAAAGCENDQVQIVIRVTPRSMHPTLKTVLKAPVVAPQASLSA
jgi:hypothetical protein